MIVRLPPWITPRFLLTFAALLGACLLGGCFFARLFGCCCWRGGRRLGEGARRASGPRHERLRAVEEDGCDAYDDDDDDVPDDDEEEDEETHSL